MNQDPQILGEARQLLGGLFSGVGRSARSAQQGETGTGLVGGIDLGQEFAEFLQMPLELAQLFTEMGFDMADMVLKSLAEAGYVLVKGLTPA